MTRARQEKRTVTEHRFIVPCEWPGGSDIGTLYDSLSWARNKASELGMDLSTDDWARVSAEDENVVITVIETKDEQ